MMAAAVLFGGPADGLTVDVEHRPGIEVDVDGGRYEWDDEGRLVWRQDTTAG